ncbi:MAG: AAA family ATPase [Lawsonibacter sp.]|nr:AAA family ATPase [Lawsonibacter sp.]
MKPLKIKTMTATFGKLDRATLEPGPGLNLIHAPNEGGKSTWAAFWRAMLYGVDTRNRDKKGYLADKNHYQPWSGAPMEGEITLEYEGRDITLRRGPRGNTPFGAFSAVYTKTQAPVPGLTAANCGELLTGVGQEVFTRSAFLGDGGLALTSAPELERRIAALVTSGGEDVSFSQAMNRLKEWKNRRQVNKSVGEIPKLEGELAQVEESLAQMEEISGEISRLEGDQAELERERDLLARQAEAHRLLARRELFQRHARAQAEYQAAREQMETLEGEASGHPVPDREALKKAQGDLQYLKVLDEEIRQGEAALKEAEAASAKAREAARDERFPEMTGEEAAAKAGADCASYQEIMRKAGTAGKYVKQFFIMLAGFLVGWLLVNLYLKGTASPFALIGLVAGSGITSLIFGLRGRSKRKTAAKLLEPYGVQTPEELTALAQAYREKRQGAEKAAHEAEVIQNALTERKEKQEVTKTELLEFVHQFAPEAQGLFGCSAALSRALNLDHELAVARERAEERRRRLEDLEAQGAPREEGEAAQLPIPELSPEDTEQRLTLAAFRLEQVSAQLNQAVGTRQAMGDPAALSARREELETALERRRMELEAIALAMDALTQANHQLQERFSPELNRLAGEYMARLTGNKYPAVSLTKDLEGFVREEGSVLPRGTLWLSRGTVDQLYLAVRLAVCRLCLPARPPIMLDDALACFDDERLTHALELLWELSGKQQTLLFTCQKREGEVLAQVPGVTRIEL